MRRAVLFTLTLSLAAGIGFISSCKKSSSPTVMTLYDSLGGTAMVADPSNTSVMIEKGRLGLRSVVDSTIFIIAADTSINKYFTVLLTEVTAGNLSGFEALSKNLTDFFCVATGAKDFTYSGKSMTDAHNPATNSRISNKVDSAGFNAFVTDLVAGAKKNGLSDDLISRVGTIVGSVEGQVVQR